MKRIESRSIVALLGAVCLSLAVLPGVSAGDLSGPIASSEISTIPRPPGLDTEVGFWIRIYSGVDTKGGLIHDSRHLGVVYDEAKFEPGQSHRSRERKTEKIKAHYREILRRLANGKRDNLTAEEARVLALWPAGTSNRELRNAANRLRFQLGQSDKFRAGVIRSGAWKDYIEDTLAEHGLPLELAALPHVESSFTPHAYSRVGAAGLWQFTRSTGRRFMRVDHVIDERLDPFRATKSAARLLKQNREVTGSWPLAITAYNHGASGMRRASRKLGTKDIETIIRSYKARTFGFASRNFFVSFLAALHVSRNYESYFGPLRLHEPIDYDEFKLAFYTPANTLTKALGIDRSVIKEANPGLRPTIWTGAKRIPKGYSIRIPRDQLAAPADELISSIPKNRQYARQTRDRSYRVRRGDTLSTISRRVGVSMSEIVALNGLRSRNRIRIGQVLKLPDNGRHAPRESRSVVKAEIPSDGLYTVRRGDSVARIAQTFSISEAQILAANDLRNRNRIYVGQTLRLRPDARPTETVVASTPAPAASPAPSRAPASTEATEPVKLANPEPTTISNTEAPTTTTTIDRHPDAVATLSSPPDRPLDNGEPIQGISLVAELPAEEPETPRLLADPSDYGVARNGTIEVQASETLGHYADWLGVRTSRLRRLNRMPYGQAIAIGQRIKLDLDQVPADQFESERRLYHQELQEEFFARFEIEGTQTHVTRRGESVWVLAQKRYRIPLWLLRQYNPDVDFAALQHGTSLTVPQIKQRENWSPNLDAAQANAS